MASLTKADRTLPSVCPSGSLTEIWLSRIVFFSISTENASALIVRTPPLVLYGYSIALFELMRA